MNHRANVLAKLVLEKLFQAEEIEGSMQPHLSYLIYLDMFIFIPNTPRPINNIFPGLEDEEREKERCRREQINITKDKYKAQNE